MHVEEKRNSLKESNALLRTVIITEKKQLLGGNNFQSSRQAEAFP